MVMQPAVFCVTIFLFVYFGVWLNLQGKMSIL